ncbi:hypothetical protein Q8F55_000831 [Vanrija albida]|uniref:Protein kinase domain-containing protein n=1 Tax=Vanrija albida TaxID=181172 RepID=A0ABR3QEK6_9TREE
MVASAHHPPRAGHGYVNNLQNTRAAQLANAYQHLAKELASDKIKVVGAYTLGKVIGEGTFGSVHIATHRLTGTRCAIKKIPKSASAQLTREIHHHRRLHHPHIVHLHEIIATETHIWLVSELCSGGELFDYLVERGRILEGEGRRLFGELCAAVGFLHRQGVVHRDLKLENVLLDGELRVKLGDLGFAREYQRGRLMETFCGTTGYASPEMLAGKKYQGVETDVWSLGIILYTLLCGGLPFDDDDERVMKDLIERGEYDEPEWLSEDARSLIRGMLRLNPSERLSMDGILNHQWFKKTMYDSLQGAVSTDDPRSFNSFHSDDQRSVPSSPMPHQTSFGDNGLKPVPSSTSISSFPFSPRTSASPQQPAKDTSNSPDADSAPSETSFEFGDSTHSKPASGDTTPTTAENEDEVGELASRVDNSGSTLDLQHQNSSQATIRKAESSPGPSSRRASRRGTLEGQKEDDTGNASASEERQLSSLPMIEEHSLPLPVADHSRTPVRTKRRSLTSQLPVERRHSHQGTSGQWQAFQPEDYLILVNTDQPPLFSTASEKQLLHQMSDLGFDTGQIVHSVSNDACDSSAAMWWILRFKQLERGETDDVVEARRASAARKRERAARRARERRGEASERSPSTATFSSAPSFTVSTTDQPRAKSLDHGIPPSSTTSTSTLLAPHRSDGADVRHSPPHSPIGVNTQTPPNLELSPPRDKKNRSPSMTMLQRATSVLALGGKKHEIKDGHGLYGSRDLGVSEPREPSWHSSENTDPGSKRADSPTKTGPIPVPARMPRSESDPTLLNADLSQPGSLHRSREPSPALIPITPASQQSDRPGAESFSRSPESTLEAARLKAPKKDSIWAQFRHLFHEDKRRKKREPSPIRVPNKPPPIAVPSRGIGARGPHMNRTPLPGSSRRASFDGNRGLYSHRSSSVNSRRSSIASNHYADFTINMSDGLHYSLNRRASGRSHRSGRSARSNGTQTPTSDHEQGSVRLRGGDSRRSSIRSPTIQSDSSGRFRAPPASPLHDYHRRAASGSSSTRVRHMKVLHEAKVMRPASVASSVRSNVSSRASSIDLSRQGERDESDAEFSQDASSVRGKRHEDRTIISHHLGTRTRSPLARSSHGSLGRGKPPLRDVFQNKDGDDDWESEDDETFAGGLGQQSSGSGSATFQTRWNVTTSYPGTPGGSSTGRFNSAGKRAPPGMASRGAAPPRTEEISSNKPAAKSASETPASSSSTSSSSSSSATTRGRRGTVGATRTQAPVIEEEDEEEE